MIGRFLAVCGWLVWQIRRRLEPTPLRRLGTPRLVTGLAVVFILAGVAPVVAATIQAQPQDATVDDVRNGLIINPEGWVRLRSKVVVPLSESPTGEAGNWGLLVDAVDELRAIIIFGEQPIETQDGAAVTGHLQGAIVEVDTRGQGTALRVDAEEVGLVPQEATVAGTSPRVIGNLIVVLDPQPLPERGVLWPLVLVPWGLAGALGIGLRVGYPVFRVTREVDVLTRPMAPGERIPAAVAGRVGERRYALHEPADAMLLCHIGPYGGGILTVQVMGAGGDPAPPPIQVGGGSGWTSGRIGYVYTVNEILPALAARSERVDATILFARVAERDRAAALVSVER